MCSSPIILALDFPDTTQALALIEQLEPADCRLKIGKEMFAHSGPQFVSKLVGKGFDVFLDLKYHDIPNTVKKACQSAADLGVWMLNVHCLGGRKMMQAAKEGVMASGHSPFLIGVTVLTSMSAGDLEEIGIHDTPSQLVDRLANLAHQSGLDGVVCSAQEAGELRSRFGKEFALVTPGIRPAGSDAGDQQRIMTPQQALEAGSNYLVIGRPITQAKNPIEVLTSLNHSLRSMDSMS
jgi:orotidine-5'-phosphate decarboxylase